MAVTLANTAIIRGWLIGCAGGWSFSCCWRLGSSQNVVDPIEIFCCSSENSWQIEMQLKNIIFNMIFLPGCPTVQPALDLKLPTPTITFLLGSRVTTSGAP